MRSPLRTPIHEAPAFAFADSCLIADVWQASDCAAAAERYNRKIRKLDGVLLAADAPMTAASVSRGCDLAGLPLHVAELANDRLMTKRAFLSAGVAAPWHAQIVTPQELQRAVIARGRDLVLKPVEQLGPATVLRLAGMDDSAAAFSRCARHRPAAACWWNRRRPGSAAGVISWQGPAIWPADGKISARWWNARRPRWASARDRWWRRSCRAEAMPQLAELSPQLGAKR